RIQAITHKLSRREELYKAFIKEAAKLYADALVHEISDVSKLVGLYAMISEMRVLSPTKTIESADEVARMIVNTYRSPNKTLPALGHDLLATKISYGVSQRHPKDESARSIYNFAVARVVQDVDRTDIEPWRHPVTVVTDEGRYTLVSPKPVDADHDPSRYDLFPTDTLKIGGEFFKTYSTVSGLGAPIAVVGRTESPHFRQQYKLRRIYAPITAIVRLSGRKASLEFMDPLNADRITLNKQAFPLAADFDAPTA